MEYSEKLVPLENGELEKYIKKQKITKIIYISFSLLIIGLFFSFVVLRSEFNVLYVLAGIIIILIPVGMLVVMSKYNKLVKADYNSGEKLVVRGNLESKYRTGTGSSTMFYFEIGPHKLKISPSVYNAFKQGDELEIHMGKQSGYVIHITEV